MAFGSSSSSSSPPWPAAMLSLTLLVLASAAKVRPPPPLHGARHLAFHEGYTQIFGSSNIALLRNGRRVRLALDVSTGE
jgi:xyloglucan:xyloglucosyl transferase